MKIIDISIPKGAIFSNDRKYRYALWRIWSSYKPFMLSIGLNPSTAGAFNDDPTITRDIVRANRLGFGGLFKANLYGYVSTDPKELLKDGNYVGGLNDYYLREMIKITACHLVCWGSFPPVTKRAPIVLEMIPEPVCLAINKDGQPKHSLYVAYAVPFGKYEGVSQ